MKVVLFGLVHMGLHIVVTNNQRVQKMIAEAKNNQ